MEMNNRKASLLKAAPVPYGCLLQAIGLILLVAAVMVLSGSSQEPPSQWRTAGQYLSDTWSQPAEHSLGPANVKNLSPKWIFTTGGDVSATPTVDDDAVYFPDWGGNLFAVEKESGRLIWSHKISDYDGAAGAFSRVSPAVDGDQLIIGDTISETELHNGANVIAVDKRTGALRWITQVESHRAAVITGSPVVFDGVVYTGISSSEEFLSANLAYICCTFRGSVVALDAKTGRLLWKTFDMPDNGGQVGGYSGGAIWQPPAIDPRRGSLFIGTGNNYTVPSGILRRLALWRTSVMGLRSNRSYRQAWLNRTLKILRIFAELDFASDRPLSHVSTSIVLISWSLYFPQCGAIQFFK